MPQTNANQANHEIELAHLVSAADSCWNAICRRDALDKELLLILEELADESVAEHRDPLSVRIHALVYAISERANERWPIEDLDKAIRALANYAN